MRQLNGVTQDAIDDANRDQGGNQVHFVDGRHRWCEEGVHEPDSSRSNTWFFLSGWPDVGDPNAAAAEMRDMFARGPIVLPNANTYNMTLGATRTRTPWPCATWRRQCATRPTAPEAQRFARANADLSSGNSNSQDVPWYAMHPRARSRRSIRARRA